MSASVTLNPYPTVKRVPMVDKTTKRKILILTVRADHGGGPRHIDLLLGGLQTLYDIWLACPKDKPYYEKWIHSGVKGIYVLPHRKIGFISLCGLVCFIVRNRISLVHSHGKGAGLYARLVKLILPWITIVHTFHGVHMGSYSDTKKRLYILYERLASLLTAKIINVSQGEKDICLKYRLFPDKKSVVIFNGIPPAPSDNQIVCDDDPKNKQIVVVTVSRFDFPKNMQLAFEIARMMRNEEEYLFLWLGDGDDAAELKLLCTQAGIKNIVFAGFQDDIGSYLAKSDVYLSTSRWEGLPIAMIEALSYGIPLVATNVVGNSEVVVDGYNGYLFEIGSPETAVKCLLSLKESADRSKFSNNAISYYNANFTLERMADAVKDVYESV